MLTLAIAFGSTGHAASSNVVVSVTIASATNLVTSGCAGGVAGRTDFGVALPGQSYVTSSDCDVAFGSSNDTSQLRISQGDQVGVAMHSATRGALDVSFDTDGRVTNATGAAAAVDQTLAVAVQSDGKVVTTGTCDMGVSGTDVCLARYNTNGSLDGTFDTDGRVTTAWGAGAAGDSSYALALQSDGRIVVAGSCGMGATGWDVCLARYNVNGSLDPTFDIDGRVTTATGAAAATDVAYGVAVQADGKIVTAGHCQMGASSDDLCLARYLTNGSLDPTFDTDGRQTTSVGAAADIARAITLQSDSKIIVAGYCDMGATGWDVCLARYHPNGSLDLTFDTDGHVTTTVAAAGASDAAIAVAMQPDGKIVTAGECAMGATGIDACLLRYHPNGSLDLTFDTDGRVTTATGAAGANDQAYSMVMQPDGRIITAGTCAMGASGNDVCLARYNSDGSLDLTFDADGRVTTATAPGAGSDLALGIAIQPDGKVVTAGQCDMAVTGTDSCLASYDEHALVSQYADDGISDWDTAGTAPRLFGACLRAVSGGATALWATNVTCPTVDGAYWNAVPTAPTKIAYNLAPEPDPPDATAHLRFGLRVSGNQPPGQYVAPVTFEVLAPNT